MIFVDDGTVFVDDPAAGVAGTVTALRLAKVDDVWVKVDDVRVTVAWL